MLIFFADFLYVGQTEERVERESLYQTQLEDKKVLIWLPKSTAFGVAIFLMRSVHTPPYHPQSNGQVERAVQDTKSLLKRKLQEGPTADWKQVINEIQKDIRFAQTPLLNGKSPVKIVYTFKPNNRFNILYKQSRKVKENMSTP